MRRGELSFSKVRALTRIAEPENERELVDLARGVTAAQLERMVRVTQLQCERVRPVVDEQRRILLNELAQLQEQRLSAEVERIAAQANVNLLEQRLADPTLYKKDPSGFAKLTEAVAAKRAELAAAEERWLELEAAREALETGRNGEFAS